MSKAEEGDGATQRLHFPEHMASGGHLGRPKPLPVGKGQESVWAAPFTRPPTLRRVKGRHVVIKVGDTVIADAKTAHQICETSHPPTWYFDPKDVNAKYLQAIGGSSTLCEFKGQAKYFNVVAGDTRVPQAAWTYQAPTRGNEAIANHIAFYLRGGVTATVDGHPVKPQPGDFYGGWITPDVVGPFKGGPGSRFW